MKNNKFYIAAAVALGFVSCADENVADFSIDKPEEVIATEQLNAYGTLLEYVGPSFKIGNTLSLEEFNQKGTATTVTITNFNEITLNGVFAHSKRVSDEGAVESKLTDVDVAVEFAKQHGITVFGGPLINSDVNSTYLNGKIVPDKKVDNTPKVTAETIDLLVKNFEEGLLPEGWRCDQGDAIHEYPEDYTNVGGARSFAGFTGYKGKAIYWRNGNAEFGAQADYPLTLEAGDYNLVFAMAAWKGEPRYYVEILDASDNSIATSDVFLATPNAEGNKSADVSAAESRELPFTISNAGNYRIRFTTKTDGWAEFLLLDCKVDVLKAADIAEYTDYLVENFEEGKLPVGWRCDQGDAIHEYPEDYSSAGGARSFEGFNGYKGKAIYWRNGNAEYGAQPDFPLTLTAGEYKLAFAVAAWKGEPRYFVEILDASDNSIASSDVFLSSPNGDGNKSADVSGAEARELPFTIVNDGNYRIRFTTKTDGWAEFLLLDCQLGTIKGATPEEPTYSADAKLAAESEIKAYVTAMITDNPEIPAWTVVENPASATSSIWYKALGSSYVTTAVKAARAANASAKLFVSEKGIEDADIRAALIDIVKASSDLDGINVAVAINENTDLSTVFSDLAATGKSIRLNILSFDTPEHLSKALSDYKNVPDAQRYGVSFADIRGIWGDNYNRTEAYKILVDSLK